MCFTCPMKPFKLRNLTYQGVPARSWSSTRGTGRRIVVTVWDGDCKSNPAYTTGTAVVTLCKGDGRNGTFEVIKRVVTSELHLAEAIEEVQA